MITEFTEFLEFLQGKFAYDEKETKWYQMLSNGNKVIPKENIVMEYLAFKAHQNDKNTRNK